MWMENIKTKDSTKHQILDAAMQVFLKVVIQRQQWMILLIILV